MSNQCTWSRKIDCIENGSACMKVLQIHPFDEMAVALANLDEGSQIEVGDRRLRLLSSVHAKHKVYLQDLPAGSTPRLYGMPAGRTTRAVRQGEAVSPHN